MDELFDTVKHVNADDSVRSCMEEYQRYLADTKLPHPVDGLKDVSRRAIYVMGTKKEFTKFAQFIASVMEVHPHGDSSIKGAIERLFRTWDVRIPLICCEGNVGSYTEVPGAPRYLDVTSADFARDLFFNGVHQSTIPMQYTIEYDSIEPKFFIPRLPNALLMGNLTIGLGFKSVVFPLNIEDVCILVQKYVEHITKDPFTAFTAIGNEKHFLPDFPTFCYLRNEKELLENYHENRFSCKVYTDGIFDITKHTIVIKNIPALLPFSRLHEKLVEILRQKNHWLNTLLRDFKDTIGEKHHGSLKLIFKNNVDVWRILPRIKKLVNFSSSLSPIYAYETEGKIITLDPPKILQYWYDARFQSIVNGLNYEQNQLLLDNMSIDAVLHVVDYKDKVVNLIKNAENTESAIQALAQKFDITLNQASIITKTSLSRLTKASKEELHKQKEDIEKKLLDNNSLFSKVPEIIYNDAAYFRKNYAKPRRTLIPVYKGYIHIGEYGIYQFDTETEMFAILREFSGMPMTIHQYRYPTHPKIVIKNMRAMDYSKFSIPRQTSGQAILDRYTGRQPLYTLTRKDGCVAYLDGWVYPKDKSIQVMYVHENFVGIFANGSIQSCNIKDFTRRKAVAQGVKSNLLYAVPYGMDPKNAVVIYISHSTGFSNSIFLIKMWNDEKETWSRLITTPPDPLTIVDVVSMDDTGIIINLPEINRTNTINHVYISDVSRLMVKRKVNISLRGSQYTLVDGSKQKATKHPEYPYMVIL